MFSGQATAHKILKQKLTPRMGYNWLYVVLPYCLYTASRLLASLYNFRKMLSVLAQKVLQ